MQYLHAVIPLVASPWRFAASMSALAFEVVPFVLLLIIVELLSYHGCSLGIFFRSCCASRRSNQDSDGSFLHQHQD
jgi:hypothetical protein